MFENLETILTAASMLIAGVTTVGGIILSIVNRNKIKSLKMTANLRDRMLLDMVEVETLYDSLKNGGKVSELKKQYVMQDLRCFALENKLSFDEELWSAEIERMIQFSDSVNAKADGKASGVVSIIGGIKK